MLLSRNPPSLGVYVSSEVEILELHVTVVKSRAPDWKLDFHSSARRRFSQKTGADQVLRDHSEASDKSPYRTVSGKRNEDFPICKLI